MSSDSVRKKIEALGTQLSLPTVRKALGALEGEHASGRRGGSGDAMDVHAYEPGDESRLIDWKTSARQGRPMVVERERLSTSRVWLLMDVGLEMTGVCPSGERAWQVAANALRMFAALSLRRSDDISLVFGDESSITRVPFNGGFAQFERTLDKALDRDWDHHRNIDALLEFQHYIEERVKPGTNMKELGEEAKAWYQNKYPNSLAFSIGHSMGMECEDVHILGTLGNIDGPFEENMVFEIEAWEEFGGALIGVEDTYVVTGDGCKKVTTIPKQIIEK